MVWWAVRTYLNFEVGIISIFIGIGVAKAIMWGSHGKGGWLYQLLAMFLTYSAVAMNYMPDIAQQFMADDPSLPAPVAYIGGFIAGYIVPVAEPASNIIGILIIAFGLYEAWKLTRRRDETVSGPFTVTPAAMPPPVPTNV